MSALSTLKATFSSGAGFDVVVRTFLEDFCRDVVKVPPDNNEPRNTGGPDFGVYPAALFNWLRQADIEDCGSIGKHETCSNCSAATGWTATHR